MLPDRPGDPRGNTGQLNRHGNLDTSFDPKCRTACLRRIQCSLWAPFSVNAYISSCVNYCMYVSASHVYVFDRMCLRIFNLSIACVYVYVRSCATHAQAAKCWSITPVNNLQSISNITCMGNFMRKPGTTLFKNKTSETNRFPSYEKDCIFHISRLTMQDQQVYGVYFSSRVA